MNELQAWAKQNYSNTVEFWVEFANRYVALAREDESLLPQIKELFAKYERIAETANTFEGWM